MLIDDLLNLACVTRAEMRRETIDFTKMASDIARAEPNQQIALKIDGSLAAHGDHRLLQVAESVRQLGLYRLILNETAPVLRRP